LASIVAPELVKAPHSTQLFEAPVGPTRCRREKRVSASTRESSGSTSGALRQTGAAPVDTVAAAGFATMHPAGKPSVAYTGSSGSGRNRSLATSPPAVALTA